MCSLLKGNSQITMRNRNGIQHPGVASGERVSRQIHTPFGTQGPAQPGPASYRPLAEGGSPLSWHKLQLSGGRSRRIRCSRLAYVHLGDRDRQISVSSSPAWSTGQVSPQQGLHREPLSHKQTNTKLRAKPMTPFF